ncbi:hypothetical protein AC249_AIPGENE12859 [Exaiptasia diaphana]|nr:hypothetical protein AC249_AIPGENE12859 [Exaiptasia diaphana]
MCRSKGFKFTAAQQQTSSENRIPVQQSVQRQRIQQYPNVMNEQLQGNTETTSAPTREDIMKMRRKSSVQRNKSCTIS